MFSCFSPRERGPDRELWPPGPAAAGSAAASAAPAQQELGRVRGRGRLGLLLRRHGPATAERQGEDHHGAHTRKRKAK